MHSLVVVTFLYLSGFSPCYAIRDPQELPLCFPYLIYESLFFSICFSISYVILKYYMQKNWTWLRICTSKLYQFKTMDYWFVIITGKEVSTIILCRNSHTFLITPYWNICFFQWSWNSSHCPFIYLVKQNLIACTYRSYK